MWAGSANGRFVEGKKKKNRDWPLVLEVRVWCGAGLVLDQWVPSSPWDQEDQGAPKVLEGPLVLDLLKQWSLDIKNNLSTQIKHKKYVFDFDVDFRCLLCNVWIEFVLDFI